MVWRSIRLELGSTEEFPAGSVSRVYLIRLPLDDRDTVDERAFRDSPAHATVRRHWSTEPDKRGVVVQSGCNWTLQCNGDPGRALCLDGKPIRLGQAITVIEPDGTRLPFKVASVR
ncbi:hypothetical protein GCM10022276_10300 [Sphingomonas limnosediminicola]|uniref:FHA domain-containing protein n=1 Tax=Sphingomonas limnosediminicola TaxID=940133 RepID=A0ABP7L4L0_9SPHN